MNAQERVELDSQFNNLSYGRRINPGDLVSVGGASLTIDNTKDIQTFLDYVYESGGGILNLQPGTYTLTADLNIPEGVTLQGLSRDNCIIDCNTDYSVKIIGSDAYADGTVTINQGDTSLIGSGTAWTSDMIGQNIYLGKDGDFFWYGIEDVVDATTITLDQPLTGTDLAGDTYTIATIVTNAHLSKVTVINSAAAGVKFQYTMETNVDDIYVTGCGIGLDFDQVLFPLALYSLIGNGINMDWNEVCGFEIRFSIASDSTAGAGIVMTSCGNATSFDSGITGNLGNGLSMTNCSGIAFVSMDFSANGGAGVEFISGCHNNMFTNINPTRNTGDGYKFTATANDNIINAGTIQGNGGYGVNIVDVTSENTIISSNNFADNTSGAVNDLGTTTLIRSNIGVADN